MLLVGSMAYIRSWSARFFRSVKTIRRLTTTDVSESESVIPEFETKYNMLF
jgi:hypothetical protein